MAGRRSSVPFGRLKLWLVAPFRVVVEFIDPFLISVYQPRGGHSP